MSPRPSRRTALTLVVILAFGAFLTGCGVGPNAISKKDYAPGDGLLAEVGDLRVQNVLVVAPPEGGDAAVLSMSVAGGGEEADRLVDVSVDGGGQARIEGDAEVPARGALRVGGEGAQAQVLLEGFSAKPGAAVSLRLRFERAGEVIMTPPVVTAEGYYEDLVAPPPTLAPSPAATP